MQILQVFASQVPIPQGFPDDLTFDQEIDYYWTIINAPESSTYFPHCYSGFDSREAPVGDACLLQVEEVASAQVFELVEGEGVPLDVADVVGMCADVSNHLVPALLSVT